MKRAGFLLLLAILCLSISGGNALASPPADQINSCTQSAFFDYENNPVNEAQDMMQRIIGELSDSVDAAMDNLLASVTLSASYQQIVVAMMTLGVIFFGVMVVFGFIQLTLSQSLILLAKIGFISWIATNAFDLVENYFEPFFVDGGAWLINAMINIATDGAIGTPGTDVSEPFVLLDEIIQIVFSPRMFVTIIATPTMTGPFGPLIALLLGWSVFAILKVLLQALQIYAVAIVMKALLLGVAPIFIPFVLFAKTKSYFTGWLNQLVNFTLQPVLLFAFLAFFATLLASTAREILPPDDVHVCYVKSDTQAATPFDLQGWRYMCKSDDGTLEPYEGAWTLEGPVDCPNAPVFPVNHVSVLVFLLLTHILKQMVSTALSIAAELSQGMKKLDNLTNGVNDWFNVARGAGSEASSNANAGNQRYIDEHLQQQNAQN